MYGKPKTAKRLYFDVIPKNVDEYHQQLRAFAGPGRGGAARQPGLAHPPRPAAGLRHGGELRDAAEPRQRRQRPRQGACSGASSAATRPAASPETHPAARRRGRPRGALLRGLRAAGEDATARPTPREAAALADLRDRLAAWDGPADAEALQNLVFAVGNEHGFEPLRAWFAAIYEVLLGRDAGAALRRLHRALRHPGDDRADRRRAGGAAGRRVSGPVI